MRTSFVESPSSIDVLKPFVVRNMSQVLLSSGTFLWLSAERPNVTDPFAPDLQAWIRNANLDPDWLRMGTDIVGGNTAHPAPTFNMAFELDGTSVPEPSSVMFVLASSGKCTRWSRSESRSPSGVSGFPMSAWC